MQNRIVSKKDAWSIHENVRPCTRAMFNYYNSKIPQEMNEKCIVHAVRDI